MFPKADIVVSPTLTSEQTCQLISLGVLSNVNSEASKCTRVYICTEQDIVDANLINQLPASLELIALAGIIADNIDLEAARARGIKVSRASPAASSIALSLKANIAAFFDHGLPLDRA